MRFFSPYLYSRLGTVRVHKKTMIVERLYYHLVTKKKIWRVVDYKTTYKLRAPRPCPAPALRALLRYSL